MIDFYTWGTPNGRKVSIMLEETNLDYQTFPIDITKDEQFDEQFLEISPNNKIPAIVDHDNDSMTLMESGAILIYLAEKSGKLLPKDGEAHWRTIEWLMLQMGGIGPMLGQVHHFVKFNPGKSAYAEARFRAEARRLYDLLDERLEQTEYLSGDYSIADIATWPWVSRFEWQNMNLEDYPHLKRWYCEIAKRPAVQRGYHVPSKIQEIPIP
ncbi:MAG: glutathione S-transferase [Gammaproteobacteria bacterium]|nr:glutathione S-transferase [Gammaproteobacteria bacterium]